MFLKKLLDKIFSKKTKFYIKPEHQTELVFECGGIRYYKFTDEFNIPAERAFSAMDIYNELDCKVTYEFLKLHCEAIDLALNNGKLTDVVSLNEMLKRRINHITEVEIMYKLASVLYFDENENPYKWDYNYALKKIEHWKKHQKDVDSFFLQMPIREYIPSFKSSEMNLKIYSQIQKKEMMGILEYISQGEFLSKGEKELSRNLEMQIIALKKQIDLEI